MTLNHETRLHKINETSNFLFQQYEHFDLAEAWGVWDSIIFKCLLECDRGKSGTKKYYK